jgi:hypothetical protein
MIERRFTGSSPWEQMNGQRQALLDRFDQAKRHARAHEVQTFHGNVAEAAFREWLTGFLPKQFGVTSGYVVSQGHRGNVKYPHFDVIIYDQLNAPILWIEDSADLSEQGKSRAIPVEYVRAVLEVKATYGASEVKDAMEHLRDLAPFYAGVDPHEERYKRYLPGTFRCCLVFFNAPSQNLNSQTVGDLMKPADAPRGFFGGVILRSEHQLPHTSGFIRLLPVALSDPIELEYQVLWGEGGFVRFAFDLVAMLNGTFNLGLVSSIHTMPPLLGPEPVVGPDGVIDPHAQPPCQDDPD